jgi:hypothetical protein
VNTKTTNRPTTVRELGDMAEQLGMLPSELLEELGPWPTPPAGYTMTKGDEDRWIGNDVVNRQYIVTPVWNGATNSRSIDLWTSREPGESDAHLTPLEAIELAADLVTMARDALASGVSE